MKKPLPQKKPSEEGEPQAQSYVNSRLFKVVNLSLCLMVAGIVFLIAYLNLLERIELLTLDLRYKLRGTLRTNPDIVLIDIDEASLNHIGRWPWSREWHATLIKTLTEYKAKIIPFDIFFSEPSPLIDFFLVEATRSAGNIFYALAFEYRAKGPVTESPAEESVLERFSISESQITGDKNNIPELARPIPLLPELYEAARGAGHVIAIPDKDGTIRKAPCVINCKGRYYLHFAIEIARDYLGLDRDKVKIILGKYIDLGPTPKGSLRIPIDKEGFFIVNWAARWGHGFKHYPFWKVISSYQKQLKGEEPLINLEEFNGKLCMVGLTATGLIDIKPIPLEPSYPIVGLHANIVNTILQHKFIKKTQLPVTLLVILLLAIFTAFTVPRFKPIGGTLFTLGIIITYILAAYLLFKFLGIWINVIYPLITITLGTIAVTIHSEVANAIEQTRLYHLAVEDGLTKLYVVRHFKEILSKEMTKSLRYQRPLSIILGDIDHFKQINDTYGHLTGDFILKGIAGIFKTSCRDADIAGRYGGEEFIILLPETIRNGAVEFAERLRGQIEKTSFEYNNIKFNTTVSFGVAELRDEASSEELIKRADEALYVAKETGRNKVCYS